MRYSKIASIGIGFIYLFIVFSADRIHNHQPTLFPQDTCPSYVLSVTSKADDYGFYPLMPLMHPQPAVILFPADKTLYSIILNLAKPTRAPPFLF